MPPSNPVLDRDAPAANGAAITSYTITGTNSAGTMTVDGDTTEAVFTGLTRGQTYRFTVVATNSAGDSPLSKQSDAASIAALEPDQVAKPTVTVDGRTATVTWDAPAANGAAITSYTIVGSNGAGTLTVGGDTTETTITGLTRGQSYRFTVVATNDIGDSVESEQSDTATIAALAPDAPAKPTVTVDSRTATITWHAPADNGAAITSYTATGSNGAGTTTVDGATTEAVFTGLTRGETYRFTVVVTNDIGDSQESAQSGAVTIAALAPDQVAKPDVTTEGRTATLTWDAPADNGAAITGYTITGSNGAGTVTVDGDTTEAVFTGLTRGQSYRFTVTATNDIDDSEESEQSDTATIAALAPDAPAKPTVTVDSRTATITWDAPAANGAAITSYTITGTKGAGTVTVDGDTTETTFNGLSRGQTYRFSVTATNEIGDSPASEQSDAATIAALAPDAPAKPTATVDGRTATVTWETPAANGAAITSYTVTGSNSAGTVTVDGDTTETTFNGLSRGQTYRFTVTATNSVGDSPASEQSDAATIAALAPDTPAKPTVTVDGRTATVTWGAPAANGAAITSYTVTGTNSAGTITVDGDTTETTFTGLTRGQSYRFSVVATNSAGDSPVSEWSDAASIAALAPNQVAKSTVTVDGRTATVTWDAPAANGAAITSYTIVGSNGAGTTTVDGDTTEATFSGLTRGQSYRFTVTATNDIGDSEASKQSDAATIAALAPDAPAKPTVTVDGRTATVTWDTPAANGSGITNYTITGTNGAGTTTVDGDTTEATFSGLTRGQSYRFTVTATNDIGDSEESAQSDAASIAALAPDAPAKPTATVDGRTATVTWDAPAANGAPIQGYTITGTNGAGTVTVDGDTTEAVFTGLTRGQSYRFTVTATNTVGDSEDSTQSDAATIAALAPDAPAKPDASVDGRSVTVTWDAPAANGSAITSYTITGTNGAGTTTVDGDTTEAVFNGLTRGQTYRFTVTATNTVGDSPASEQSDPASVQEAVAPDRPGKPSLKVNKKRGKIVIRWKAPKDNGFAITEYQLKINRGLSTKVSGNKTKLVLKKLRRGRYTVKVAATNEGGRSKWSKKAVARLR